ADARADRVPRDLGRVHVAADRDVAGAATDGADRAEPLPGGEPDHLQRGDGDVGAGDAADAAAVLLLPADVHPGHRLDRHQGVARASDAARWKGDQQICHPELGERASDEGSHAPVQGSVRSFDSVAHLLDSGWHGKSPTANSRGGSPVRLRNGYCLIDWLNSSTAWSSAAFGSWFSKMTR